MVALPRPGKISTHRPVSFRIVPPQRADGQQPPLSESIVLTDEWGIRVRLRHTELWQQEAREEQVGGNRKLVLLKRAMQEVANTMQAEKGQRPAHADSDRLSVLVRTVRA